MLAKTSISLLIGSLLLGVGAAYGAEEDLVRVTREDCLQLTRYIPSDDVNYQAGADVNGRPVALADLNPTFQPSFSDRYSFVLEFQPLPDEERLELSTFALGVVTVDAEGHVYFDGEPLHYDEEAELQRLCQEALEG